MNITKSFGGYAKLPRSIYVLFAMRVVNAMGNFVYPFLTLFLTNHMGLSPKEIGLYFVVTIVASRIGSLVGGKLADHFGRKKLLFTFQALGGVCLIPCAFLGNSILIPILLIVSGIFGGAAQPASSAMVNDLTNKENRKEAFSLLYLGINIGFAVGPSIAGFLYANHTKWIFIGNVISIFISLILLAVFVEETMPSKEKVEESRNINDGESAEDTNAIKALLKRPELLMFVLGYTLNQFIYTTIGFAIPLQLGKLFGNDIGGEKFGLMMSFTGIVVLVCTLPIIKLTGKFKPVANMVLAGYFYAIGFGMMGVFNSFNLFLLAGFVFTVGEILEATNAGIFIANHSPITHRGRFNAIIPLITGMGSLFGPLVFGWYIEVHGLPSLWLLCFVLGAISGTYMLWLSFYENKKKEVKSSVGA